MDVVHYSQQARSVAAGTELFEFGSAQSASLSFFKLTGQNIGLNGIKKLPTLEILTFCLCFDWDLGAVLAFCHGI